MLIHADNLCLPDIGAFVRAHEKRPRGTEITMMTFTTPTPETCAIVEVDERGVVQAFYEKQKNPTGNLANAAVYIVEPAVMEFLSDLTDGPVIDFSTDVLPHYMGRIYTYHNAVYHRDIGTLESYLAAQLEYPGPSPVPAAGFDSWKDYAQSGNRAEEFAISLSKALGAGIIRPGSDDGQAREENKAKYVLNASEEKAFQKPANLGDSDCFVFFPWVSPGFSSKSFYKLHCIENLAFCACE